MSSIDFTEEHDFFRKSFKDFLQKEVVPHIEKWEKTGSIDRFIWEKFGEMGYFGLVYPEQYGFRYILHNYFLGGITKSELWRFCCRYLGTRLFGNDPFR